MLNTIQKEIRNKNFIFLVFSTIVVMVIWHLLANFLLNEFLAENLEMFKDTANSKAPSIMFTILGLWSLIISIILGSGLIRSDMETNVLPILLSYPISRFEYLTARILGLWVLVIGYYLFSFCLGLASISALTHFPHFGIGALVGFFYRFLAILAVIILTSLISLNLSKVMTVLLTCFFTFLIVATNTYFTPQPIADYFSNLSAIKGMAAMIHILLPHIGTLNDLANNAFFESKTNISYQVETLHFIVTTGILIFVIKWLFQRREL